MTLLAIDPGNTECACAYFTPEGVLYHATFEIWPDPGPYQIGTVVCERMQVDERTRAINPKHLLNCQYHGALAMGYAAGRYGARTVSVTPTEWKGSEPKPVHHARLWSLLGEQERAELGGDATHAQIKKAVEKGALKRWKIAGADCYPSRWKGHNLLDAAALGATYLGRMEKR